MYLIIYRKCHSRKLISHEWLYQIVLASQLTDIYLRDSHGTYAQMVCAVSLPLLSAELIPRRLVEDSRYHK